MVIDESEWRYAGRVACVRAWERPGDDVEADRALPVLLEPGPTWPLTQHERADLDRFAAPVGLFGPLDRTSAPAGARRLRAPLAAALKSSQDVSCALRAHLIAARPAARDRPDATGPARLRACCTAVVSGEARGGVSGAAARPTLPVRFQPRALNFPM